VGELGVEAGRALPLLAGLVHQPAELVLLPLPRRAGALEVAHDPPPGLRVHRALVEGKPAPLAPPDRHGPRGDSRCARAVVLALAGEGDQGARRAGLERGLNWPVCRRYGWSTRTAHICSIADGQIVGGGLLWSRILRDRLLC
jgi:hypothetical protein